MAKQHATTTRVKLQSTTLHLKRAANSLWLRIIYMIIGAMLVLDNMSVIKWKVTTRVCRVCNDNKSVVINGSMAWKKIPKTKVKRRQTRIAVGWTDETKLGFLFRGLFASFLRQEVMSKFTFLIFQFNISSPLHNPHPLLYNCFPPNFCLFSCRPPTLFWQEINPAAAKLRPPLSSKKASVLGIKRGLF